MSWREAEREREIESYACVHDGGRWDCAQSVKGSPAQRAPLTATRFCRVWAPLDEFAVRRRCLLVVGLLLGGRHSLWHSQRMRACTTRGYTSSWKTTLLCNTLSLPLPPLSVYLLCVGSSGRLPLSFSLCASLATTAAAVDACFVMIAAAATDDHHLLSVGVPIATTTSTLAGPTRPPHWHTSKSRKQQQQQQQQRSHESLEKSAQRQQSPRVGLSPGH